jgi:monoamine oxidase
MPSGAASYDAIVVGGGLAGLRACRDLSDTGYTALLIEGRDRLGGRTWCRPFRGHDHPVELGGTWVAPEHNHFVRQEMDRYGLKLAARPPEVRFSWRFDGARSGRFPLEPDEVFQLERALYRIMASNERIDPEVPRDEQDLRDLDVSVDQFLSSCALDGRVYDFLAAFGSLGSGATPTEWSALTACSLMAAFGGSAYAWFGGVVDKLAGGTAALVSALLSDANPEVKLSTRVTRVQQSASAATVVTQAGERISASVVIVAVPVNTWREIEFAGGLSPAKAELSRVGHPNRMGKVWMLVEEAPPATLGFGPGNDLLFIAPQYELGRASLMVGFFAPPSRLDSSDRGAVAKAVRQYFPRASVAAVDGHDWNSDPFSKGGWQTYRPGQLSRLHSALQAPEGRVLFAGADIAVRWIGWMDGALETGARAARQALELLAPDARQRRRPA